jgi:AhpD family alkylhydroperoxidase
VTARINPYEVAPHLMQPLIDLSRTIGKMSLEPALVELVKIRASQMNGCALCLDMHAREARWNGENEQRIYMLNAWRESALYGNRERAALAWTEALTRLADTGASDDVYQQLAKEFTAEEQVKLTLLIIAINGFNRVGVGFRLPPMDVDASARQAA